MRDFECPYCRKYIDEPEDYPDEDEIREHQCELCEKNFVFTISYIRSFSSERADCLNGQAHKFKQINGLPREYFIGKKRCTDCGKEITESLDQLKAGKKEEM